MRKIVWALKGLVIHFLCLLFLSNTTFATEPNLVNWWKFDEMTGSIAYDSAGTNNGTIYGATWTTGQINGALNFNGSSNYIDCGSAPSNYDNITVSAWMKTSTNGILVSNRYNSGGYGTWYTLSSTGIELGGNSSGSGYMNVTFNTPTLDDTWHHIVYTKNGTNHAIYVDGYLDQSFSSNADISWNAPLYIGKRWNRSNNIGWFNGVVDDVRIYNRALSADEIQQLFLSGMGKANNPNPPEGASNVIMGIVLSWTPGRYAVSHDVYFGTDFNDVNDANTIMPPGVFRDTVDVNFYDPGGLQRDTSYYWRIDEVNDINVWKGDIWSFTTAVIWKLNFNFPDDPLASNVIFENDPRWVKFTIKLDDPCTVYFQDSKMYEFHYDFATEWLEPFIGMTVQEYDNVTMYDVNQEASLGAVILPPMTGNPPVPEFNEYGIQFIRYDAYTKEEIASMFNAVKNSVIADPCVKAIYFPTYEQLQTANANLAWFESQGIIVDSLSRWLTGNICYSKGWAIGNIKYFPGSQIQSAYTNGDLGPDDILMTDGVPAEVPYVAGIISLSSSTPNSHVAILSNTYVIPFVYLANTSDVSTAWQLVDKLTVLCVQETSGVCSVQLKDAMANYTSDEIAEMLDMKTPGILDISPIVPYGSLSADANNLLPGDINKFGGKAANYGMLRTSIPDNSPRAAAISFDLWNAFLDQPLTPCESTIISPGGYMLFWADSQPEQGVRHTNFKLSKSGEAVGLFDSDGSLVNGLNFGAQSTNVSYGRTPDGNNNWTFFYGSDVTPNATNPGEGTSPTQGLFINEFMADNTTFADEFSEFDDWIEIYNAGPAPVDLGGMYLTDDLSNPTKWMIPVGLTGNNLREEIANRLAGFYYPPSNLAELSAQLAVIRNLITNPNITHFTQQQQDAIIALLQDPNYGFDPDKNIRFRSSTNVEDSEKFSGAGLYDSYSGCLADDLDADTSGPCACDPNETAERGVFRAIRKVLASFYNENAYLERMRHEVNEANVGMAMLVHHSFPDEIELANGVATMERKSGQTSWDIKLVTQKGAASVTNPVEAGLTPEEVSAYADHSGGMSMTLIHQSNLVILGEKVMTWQDDYNDLIRLLVTAAERFEQVTGKTDYILDLEYKKVAPGGAALPTGGIDVDQIRQIPMITDQTTCPTLSYTCVSPPFPHSYLINQTYEDSDVSLETSYYLYCPADYCLNDDFYSFCRTIIQGYTTRPIVMFTGVAEKTYWGMNHYSWLDFYFTPSQEPGMDQCLLNQLRAKDIRVIHLQLGYPQNTIEITGFGAGPYYLGDFEPDGDVDLVDFSMFAQRWLNTSCGLCGNADFNCDENVDMEDLKIFTDNWLAH